MIVVVGGNGLLGSWIQYLYPKETIGYSHQEIDISDEWVVLHTLKNVMPDAVINCAGVTNKVLANPFEREDANIHGPQVLAKCCDVVGAKLVHVSTDCVFSGKRGNYTEENEPDTDENYGWTKWMGEVTRSPHLTVRTSFIGFPDPKGRGLLHQFHNHSEIAINGFRGVLWNGLCVNTLARLLVELAYGRQTGLMHLFGDTAYSKYEILLMAQYVYGHTWDEPYVLPVDDPVINRTLSTVRYDQPKPIENLFYAMCDMRDHEERFNEWWKRRKSEYQL